MKKKKIVGRTFQCNACGHESPCVLFYEAVVKRRDVVTAPKRCPFTKKVYSEWMPANWVTELTP